MFRYVIRGLLPFVDGVSTAVLTPVSVNVVHATSELAEDSLEAILRLVYVSMRSSLVHFAYAEQMIL